MHYPYVMFDWGDTLMKDNPALNIPMCQWPTVEAIDGAKDILNEIYTKRKIVLVTSANQSTEADIRLALQRVNIEKYFYRIYCFKNTGFKKPSEEFYNHVLLDLCTQAEKVLMIGDDFENDILGVNRLGIFAVWFNHKSTVNKKGALYQTVYSLRDVLNFLDT